MGPNPTCQTCRHHVGEPYGAGKHRDCRANPPVFATERPTNTGHVFLAQWPMTRPEDGCGAHEAIEPEPGPDCGEELPPGLLPEQSASNPEPEDLDDPGDDDGPEGDPGPDAEPTATPGDDHAPRSRRKKRRR